jgi:hypothetical protein
MPFLQLHVWFMKQLSSLYSAVTLETTFYNTGSYFTVYFFGRRFESGCPKDATEPELLFQ